MRTDRILFSISSFPDAIVKDAIVKIAIWRLCKKFRIKTGVISKNAA